MKYIYKGIINGKARTHCELCGRKLSIPETDIRNTAVCKTCLRGQGFKITKKTKPFGLKV